MSIPAISLPLVAALFDGHTQVGESVLGFWQLAAVFTSGPGGFVARAWEENFPISRDWAYLCIMGVLSMGYWGAVYCLGRMKGRPLLILFCALVLSFFCGLNHFWSLVAAHT